jgi:hypothetical protein
MNYESNDERIERLENQVAKLLSAQRAELRLIEADEQHQRAMNIHFLKSAVLLKNNQDALAHCTPAMLRRSSATSPKQNRDLLVGFVIVFARARQDLPAVWNRLISWHKNDRG